MTFRVLTIPLCTLILLALTTHQASSGPQATADEAGISTVLKQQQAAWNHGDINEFMAGYWESPELTFAGSSGVNRGWEAVRARYHRQYPDKSAMGKLDFGSLEVRALGPDSALVLGRWHLQRGAGDLGGVFTLVFQRFSEGWRIIHDHTSLDSEVKQ